MAGQRSSPVDINVSAAELVVVLMFQLPNSLVFFGFIGSKPVDVLFLSSSIVDEPWIRSTALQCNSDGLRVAVVVCGGNRANAQHVKSIYRRAGIKTCFGISLSAAARISCEIVVTASSGLNREIFPTRANKLVHMPHSLASLHMIYPEGTFDGYDVLSAAGPHHVAEFEAISGLRGLESRKAFPVGYGKLDLLEGQMSSHVKQDRDSPLVLVAPSWGQDNLLDNCGKDLIDALLNEGFYVVVRPHPLFFQEKSELLCYFQEFDRSEPKFRLESPWKGDHLSIFDADVLVGDYSGINFEFAALHGRSVVSVDVGKKVANPSWRALDMDPVEVNLRNRIGIIVAPVVEKIVEAVRFGVEEGSQQHSEVTKEFLCCPPGECARIAAARIRGLLKAEAR